MKQLRFKMFLKTFPSVFKASGCPISLKELQESEELFSSTFYQAAVGMVHVQMADGRFVRANNKICEMLGYTEEELCCKNIVEVTHADDIQIDLDNTRKMMLGEISMFSI